MKEVLSSDNNEPDVSRHFVEAIKKMAQLDPEYTSQQDTEIALFRENEGKMSELPDVSEHFKDALDNFMASDENEGIEKP